MSVFPGLAIVLTVLALNLIGDGLNDTFNPRISRQGRA
jgi:peptide/nickel transport system permease protein